jgi:hypothetical protein
MIEYLLVLHLCSNIDGDCTWTRMRRFPSAEVCQTAGLAAKPSGAQFKCVMQAAPDSGKTLIGRHHVPLPRPRPETD